MTSLITSTVVIVSLMLVWSVVQWFWKQAFPEDVVNDDALAGRDSCGNCTCSGTCSIKAQLNQKH
ncbi:MAG: hypothetical protein CMB80_21360 [Flammeovirgaceae bacterium]|nr:hypothetical protein [Flammeovirgaceae bacterium]MBR06873.1 hypothetical protein [Rickettsiales bacterium]HCX24158.1 hypothetical protein [Cytophagales bacterium]|tara:strand:+ start:361 stop:555 length:195 start_codon:yes stop_codon:yes gene_type:complete